MPTAPPQLVIPSFEYLPLSKVSSKFPSSRAWFPYCLCRPLSSRRDHVGRASSAAAHAVRPKPQAVLLQRALTPEDGYRVPEHQAEESPGLLRQPQRWRRRCRPITSLRGHHPHTCATGAHHPRRTRGNHPTPSYTERVPGLRSPAHCEVLRAGPVSQDAASERVRQRPRRVSVLSRRGLYLCRAVTSSETRHVPVERGEAVLGRSVVALNLCAEGPLEAPLFVAQYLRKG